MSGTELVNTKNNKSPQQLNFASPTTFICRELYIYQHNNSASFLQFLEQHLRWNYLENLMETWNYYFWGNEVLILISSKHRNNHPPPPQCFTVGITIPPTSTDFHWHFPWHSHIFSVQETFPPDKHLGYSVTSRPTCCLASNIPLSSKMNKNEHKDILPKAYSSNFDQHIAMANSMV